MFVILNFAPDGATIAGLSPCAFLVVIPAKTQILDQVKTNSTSQFFFQKLLKCFSGIITSAFVNESIFSSVFPTMFVFYLKDSESEESGLLGSSL